MNKSERTITNAGNSSHGTDASRAPLPDPRRYALKYLWILVALLPFASRADDFFEAALGAEPNHLTPVGPPDDYDKRIAEHLFLTSGSFGRFITRPSFGAESCVSIHAEISKETQKKQGAGRAVPEEQKKYFITVTRASESLWNSMAENNVEHKTRKIKVARIDREISLELAIAIQRAWGRMLQHTKYPAEVSSGLDGITYQFSVWVRGLGDLYGETWSPGGGLPAEIASLGSDLATFGANKKAEEKPLIEKLKAFEAKIPKASSD